jgi:tellurium resistance protein TerD
MGVSLQKGGNVSLSKSAARLKNILVGLGWSARATSGAAFDLDASAFLVGENGKVHRDEDFIFYNNSVSKCGSVEHTGDERTGESDGDDEAIKVGLEKVPASVKRIVVCVTIHDGASRKQNFGQVSDAFMRIVNAEGEVEIARFDLTEDYSTETAMIFGEVYRNGDEWKFKAVGQGFTGGLEAMCRQFGVAVD